MWTDPKASAIALGVLHLFFAYLSVTSNTTFNLGNIFVDHYAYNLIFYRLIHINGYANFPTKHFNSFIVLWTVIAGCNVLMIQRWCKMSMTNCVDSL